MQVSRYHAVVRSACALRRAFLLKVSITYSTQSLSSFGTRMSVRTGRSNANKEGDNGALANVFRGQSLTFVKLREALSKLRPQTGRPA